MTSTTKRAIGYIRVSTGQQAESHLGVEAQLRAIQLYCKKRGLHLARTYTDEGVSSRVKLWERPGGSTMNVALAQADLSEPWSYHVVAHSMSRLWRSFHEGIVGMDEFKERKIGLHLVKDGIDVDSEEELTSVEKLTRRIQSSMLLAFVEFERDLASERTTEALAEKAARGEPVGCPPYGYCYKRKRLVEKKDELIVLGCALILYERDVSYRAIAQRLTAFGWTSRKGSPFTKETVRHMVKPRYRPRRGPGRPEGWKDRAKELYVDWVGRHDKDLAALHGKA